MSNEDNIKTTEFERLVNQYQDTRAPLGFAERVMAHANEDKTRQPDATPFRAFVTSLIVVSTNHKFAYAASIGLVVLSTIIIVNSINDTKPDLQIAKKEEPLQITPAQPPAQPATEQTTQKTPAQPEKQQSTMVATVSKSVETQSKVKITKEEQEIFFQASNDSDSTSLAVLTDISDWLVEQKEMTAPDISDLPDLNEIDNLFDTT